MYPRAKHYNCPCALHILYVTQIHDPYSYELEQLESNDDTKSDSNTYWVTCNARACLLVLDNKKGDGNIVYRSCDILS